MFAKVQQQEVGSQMKTKSKRRRVSVDQESYETRIANMINDSLLYLNASDIEEGCRDVIPFWNSTLTEDDIIEPFNVVCSQIVPGEWTDSTLYHSRGAFMFDVMTIRSLDVQTVKRMRSLGALKYGGDGVLKTLRTRVKKDGTVSTEHDRYLVQDGYMLRTDEGQFIKKTLEGDSSREQFLDMTREASAQVSFGIVTHYLRKSRWIVSFSCGSERIVSVPTDPTGIKGMFQMRELPEGRDRRAALLHWVSAHMRRNRKDPETEHAVRQYLRGSREFEWFGMSCKITPTEF